LGSSGSFTVEGDPDDAAGAPPEELAVVATLVVRIPVPDAETATWLAEWGGQVLAEVLARALQATYAEAGVRPDWLVSGFFELLSVGSSPAAARRLTQADVGTGLGALAMGGVRLVFRSNDGGADPDAMTALLDALNVQLLSWIERLSAGDINTQWHTAVQVRDPEAPAVALDPVDVADTGLGQLVSVIDVPELQASEGGFSDEEGNGLAIWLLLPAGVIACLAVVATALCVLRPCVAGSVLLGRQADL
jgi:hypothetical protein